MSDHKRSAWRRQEGPQHCPASNAAWTGPRP